MKEKKCEESSRAGQGNIMQISRTPQNRQQLENTEIWKDCMGPKTHFPENVLTEPAASPQPAGSRPASHPLH